MKLQIENTEIVLSINKVTSRNQLTLIDCINATQTMDKKFGSV